MLSECWNSFSVGGFAPLDPQPGLCPGPAWDIKWSPDSLSLGAYIIICYAPALCLINITLNPLKHRPTCIKALYPFVHSRMIGVVLVWVTPSNWKTALHTSLWKSLPCFVWISKGAPNLAMNSSTSLLAVVAMLRSSTSKAPTPLVNWSVMIVMSSLPHKLMGKFSLSTGSTHTMLQRCSSHSWRNLWHLAQDVGGNVM